VSPASSKRVEDATSEHCNKNNSNKKEKPQTSSLLLLLPPPSPKNLSNAKKSPEL
jgi:hypothetical protein